MGLFSKAEWAEMKGVNKLATSADKAGSEQISSVPQAAMRLGVNSVRSIALGFTLVSDNRGGGCTAFDYDQYWSESLAMAVAASALARKNKSFDPAGAFTCALMSNVGKLAVVILKPRKDVPAQPHLAVGVAEACLAFNDLEHVADNVSSEAINVHEGVLAEPRVHVPVLFVPSGVNACTIRPAQLLRRNVNLLKVGVRERQPCRWFGEVAYLKQVLD